MFEKRKIEEIIATYILEPKIRDIFVEGSTDARVLNWFISSKGKENVYVSSIDIIDIPPVLMSKYRLRVGSQKNKLIAFSNEINNRLAGKKRKLLCIVDKDFDEHLKRDYRNKFLFYTDYSCIESYLFNRKIISKFISLVLGGIPISINSLIKLLTAVLQNLFVIRLTNEKLNWQMDWLPFKKNVTVNKRSISFNEDRFIDKYLLKNGRIKYKRQFTSEVQELRKWLLPDRRSNINGHDFTSLFFFIIKKYKTGKTFSEETFAGSICGCLEISDIEKEKLFQEIMNL